MVRLWQLAPCSERAFVEAVAAAGERMVGTPLGSVTACMHAARARGWAIMEPARAPTRAAPACMHWAHAGRMQGGADGTPQTWLGAAGSARGEAGTLHSRRRTCMGGCDTTARVESFGMHGHVPVDSALWQPRLHTGRCWLPPDPYGPRPARGAPCRVLRFSSHCIAQIDGLQPQARSTYPLGHAPLAPEPVLVVTVVVVVRSPCCYSATCSG